MIISSLSLSTMHRLSLGSPVGKLLSHGGGAPTAEDFNRQKDFSVSSSSITECHGDDNQKASKRHRFSFSTSPSTKPEKFLHAIPILMFFCFLILYLCSHTPSQSDLAQFRGFKSSMKYTDSSKFRGDEKPFSELQRGKFLVIQSLRNLQGIGGNIPISRSHRKIADFELS